jgi:hypothetical protein
MLCATTVIEKDDLSDQLLNRKLNPDWRGERTSMLDSFPVHLNDGKGSDINWDEYNKIRIEGLNEDDNGQMANDYYSQNRDILDEGAVVTWEGIKQKKHISAIQSAMELYLKDPKGFFSEYQNMPKSDEDESNRLQREEVLKALNGLKINEIQEGFNIETLAIDLNDYALSWAYCSIKNDMTTNICNYGQYPEGSKNVWDVEMGITREEAFTNALVWFIRESHKQYPNALIGIDGNWQTQTAHQVCKQMNREGIKCYVLRGKSYKIFRYKKQSDKRLIGENRDGCYYQKGVSGNEIDFNSDLWHMRTQGAFRIQSPAPGSLSVFGSDPKKHLTLADHCVADRLLAHFVRDGKVYFDWFKSSIDHNDIFDSVSMCQVLANMFGAGYVEAGQYKRVAKKKRRKKKVARNFN